MEGTLNRMTRSVIIFKKAGERGHYPMYISTLKNTLFTTLFTTRQNLFLGSKEYASAGHSVWCRYLPPAQANAVLFTVYFFIWKLYVPPGSALLYLKPLKFSRSSLASVALFQLP